jgi:Ca-activated chloride channel homolog
MITMQYLLPISLLFAWSVLNTAQLSGPTVKGTVTDSVSKLPVAGATIVVLGTKTAVTSGSDGQFSIPVSARPCTLVCSMIGYHVAQIKVTSESGPVFIRLCSASSQLSEVVVVGYGKSADSEIMEMAPLSQDKTYREPAGELVGKVPGIRVKSSRLTRHNLKAKNGHWDPDMGPEWNREGYDEVVENRFLTATENPLSTFSIDVDGASYSNVRRFLQSDQLPPAGSVRIEELINYFHYDYPQPKGEDPFSINTEIADCPWSTQNKLVMIGLQGKKIPTDKLPASNLVFLIDVSGSMFEPDKLPLVKSSLKLLVDQLREQDRVSLVVYAGNAGLVMPSTSGSEKQKIRDAIDALEAGGSTAGGAGIELAYDVARKNFVRDGNNRVILCTDGDFNVGPSSDAALEDLIEKERMTGVYLTVLGFGQGNYQDSKMQKLADKGNGNHSYIDNLEEARKVLVNEFGGTLFTIAKDVKLQVEFNPQKVQAYRLIGYENRLLNKEDFNNDKKDAGDLGSGHTVTALYEIIPVGVKSRFIEKTDSLKYQSGPKFSVAAGDELMTVKFRYKKPDEVKSRLLVHSVIDQHLVFGKTSDNFRFVAAVAQFGMLLRNSEFRQQASFNSAFKLAEGAQGEDREGYRSAFLGLLKRASRLSRPSHLSDAEEVGCK